MNITITALVEAIQASTEKITVMTTSQDFYARRGDTEESTLEYINPYQLIQFLENLEGA